MSRRLGLVMVVGAISFGLSAPSAMAGYSTWGTLRAYEGSRLVAEGKGTIGVDFTRDVVGGHVGQRDPRPGGSPAYSRIQYVYEQPVTNGPYNLRGTNNYTSSWTDQFKAGNLNTSYTMARMNAATCQHDALGPDACRVSGDYNQKW
jgi:hypothetical protein